ncbi:MAG: hypothetical protein UZ15_CFX003003255 [Chloroflexi bacterium OLB15]|nr:MAG: hypothetical protein UZ15_CFX003003255 [Chloroflexi bacterium OLB15]
MHIYLTKEAEKLREEVVSTSAALDKQIRVLFNGDDFETFLRVLTTLQTLEPDYSDEMITPANHKGKLTVASMNGHSRN